MSELRIEMKFKHGILFRIRQEKGLTQSQMAELIGISKHEYVQLELLKNIPRKATVKDKLVDYLGISKKALLDEYSPTIETLKVMRKEDKLVAETDTSHLISFEEVNQKLLTSAEINTSVELDTDINNDSEITEELLTSVLGKPLLARVLALHYGLGGNKSLTLEEIGKEVNLPRERVRQVKKRTTL